MQRTKQSERIDIGHDYAVCAWARHFNVSEKTVKEAVAAVGDSADKVREHITVSRRGNSASQERPSGN